MHVCFSSFVFKRGGEIVNSVIFSSLTLCLPASVIEAVFLEYARYLQSLGLSRGMRHFCARAGEKGKKLLEQYHSSGLKIPASYNASNEPT